MKKDSKRLILYLCVLFAAKALSCQLPHDSYSVMDYVFRPIRIGSSVIYLANILTLILFLVAALGILSTEHFRRHMKIIGLLYIFLILIPLMGLVMDFTRIAYHTAARDGIHSIDIQKSDITLSQVNNTTMVNVTLSFKNYSFFSNEFGVRIYFPESLSEYIGSKYYDFESKYSLHNYFNHNRIYQQITIDTQNIPGSSFPADWSSEDYKYELYDENTTVTILEHGQ